MSLQTTTIRLTGISPLILHSGQFVDPSYWATKAIKSISGKRKKTEADLAEMARLEFLGALCVNADKKIIIPNAVLTAVMTDGAKVSKQGRQAKSGVFVTNHALLEFPDADKSLQDLYALDQYKLYVAVKVGQAKVMRMRPTFPTWAVALTVHFNDQQLNAKDVLSFAQAAGAERGMGDWRPQNGRFTVELVRS